MRPDEDVIGSGIDVLVEQDLHDHLDQHLAERHEHDRDTGVAELLATLLGARVLLQGGGERFIGPADRPVPAATGPASVPKAA